MKVQECPQCGATVEESERQCRYCKSRFFVDTPQPKPEANSPSSQTSMSIDGQTSNSASGVKQRVANYRKEFSAPLPFAAMAGDAEGVRLLLEEGADVDERDDDDEGKTALHKASSAGRIEVMNLLLENGADINAEDNEGITPLLWAVMTGQVSAVETLLENGADTTHEDSKGRTALKAAKKVIDLGATHQKNRRILELLKLQE